MSPTPSNRTKTVSGALRHQGFFAEEICRIRGPGAPGPGQPGREGSAGPHADEIGMELLGRSPGRSGLCGVLLSVAQFGHRIGQGRELHYQPDRDCAWVGRANGQRQQPCCGTQPYPIGCAGRAAELISWPAGSGRGRHLAALPAMRGVPTG
jgi:hypothetical protein